jgi:hypothetical protein
MLTGRRNVHIFETVPTNGLPKSSIPLLPNNNEHEIKSSFKGPIISTVVLKVDALDKDNVG